MELLEKYFAELIQCVDASYLVIGIILVFLSVPDTADYAPYRKAKYFLASAFLLCSSTCIFGWKSFPRKIGRRSIPSLPVWTSACFPDMYMLCLFVCLPVGFAIYQ